MNASSSLSKSYDYIYNLFIQGINKRKCSKANIISKRDVDKTCHDCMMPVSTIATDQIRKFHLLFEERMFFLNTVYHEQACCISALAAFIAEIKHFIYINFYINMMK